MPALRRRVAAGLNQDPDARRLSLKVQARRQSVHRSSPLPAHDAGPQANLAVMTLSAPLPVCCGVVSVGVCSR